MWVLQNMDALVLLLFATGSFFLFGVVSYKYSCFRSDDASGLERSWSVVNSGFRFQAAACTAVKVKRDCQSAILLGLHYHQVSQSLLSSTDIVLFFLASCLIEKHITDNPEKG